MASISFSCSLSFPERIHFNNVPHLEASGSATQITSLVHQVRLWTIGRLQKKVTCNAWLIDISLGLQKDSEKGFTPNYSLFHVLSLLQNIDADNGEVSLAIPDPLISIEQLNSRNCRTKTAVAYLLLCQTQQYNQRPRQRGIPSPVLARCWPSHATWLWAQNRKKAKRTRELHSSFRKFMRWFQTTYNST